MEKIEICQIDESMLDGVAELESLCFSSPWSKESLALLTGVAAMGICAVGESGRVYAYVGMLIVLDEGQITNVAVHPEMRRRGLGESVVSALIESAVKKGIVSFSLEVRESNVGAISLYEKLGFSVAGVRKGFYTQPKENALVMIKNIEDTAN